MSRLLALSLLALAAPCAAAEQVHAGQTDNPSCSAGMSLEPDYQYCRDYLDRPQTHPCLAETPPCSLELAIAIRDLDEASRRLDELWRETGPGTAAWAEGERHRRHNRTRQPRHYVPYPLSRELLTGAVNPCDSAYASCPPELDNIYDGLSEARRRNDQSRLEMYQRSLRYYYYEHRP